MRPSELRPGIARLVRLAVRRPGGAAADAEVEIELHLALRAEQLARAGLAPAAARAEAERRFGPLPEARQRLHHSAQRRENRMRLQELAHAARQDLRVSLRGLRRAPGFVVTAVLCLALGIGATTAVLAVADAVLLRPLAAPALDRLVVVREDLTSLGLRDALLDPPGAEDVLARRDLFEGGAAFDVRRRNLSTADAEPRRVQTVLTLGDFFGVWGAGAAAGRLYPAVTSRTPGAPQAAVLSYAFWREHFGGERAVVGRTIRLDGVPLEVVGVAGASLRYPRGADVYLPYPVNSSFARQRGRLVMTTIARVRPGVTADRLAAGLREQADRWREELRATGGSASGGVVLHATPLVTYVAGELRPITRVLLGAVLLVLVVACANVACLQLVRATGRARELAVRAAVGASRLRLAAPLAAESLLLAIAGGVLGAALAAATLAALRAWGPAQYPQLADARLDPRALATALIATTIAAVGFGLAPAVRAVRTDPHDALRGTGRGTSVRADRTRFLRGAVVTQVALALALASGAALLVRSFARLVAADPGFRAEAVLTAQFGLPRAAYREPERRLAAFEQVAARLRGAPGVSAVAVSAYLPFGGDTDSSPFTVVGADAAPAGAAQPHAEYNLVSEDYFRVLGIPLRRGRAFTPADALRTPPVVVIDEQLAREFFPGVDPVGRRLRQMGEAEIVGVVGAVARAQLGEARKAMIYYPLRQTPWPPSVTVAVRGTLPAPAAERLVRSAVAEVDAQVPVYDVRPMAARVEESVGGRRLATVALGAFAGVALVLAALGVHGVLSYAVVQRTRELGVRAALGARAADLERMVVGGAVRLAAIGAAAGLVLFAVGRRGLAALLYGVEATDPAALAGGVGALAAAILVASWLPARRAARTDPAMVMRAE